LLRTETLGLKDDLNLYAYVGNDPLDKSDPTGLGPWDDFTWGLESGAGETLHRAGMDLPGGNVVAPGPNVNPNSGWATFGSGLGAVLAGASRQQLGGLAPVAREATLANASVSELRAVAREVRTSASAVQAAQRRVVAVGVHEDGQTSVAGNNGLDKGQRAAAKNAGIDVVIASSGGNLHAEERLIKHADETNNPLVKVGTDPQPPCGPGRHDCAGQLDQLKVAH
jgi:uncharacterized protein RhaS with RHS repeats